MAELAYVPDVEVFAHAQYPPHQSHQHGSQGYLIEGPDGQPDDFEREVTYPKRLFQDFGPHRIFGRFCAHAGTLSAPITLTWKPGLELRKFELSFKTRYIGTMTAFRPCIDLHQGKVKQIVGGTLSD